MQRTTLHIIGTDSRSRAQQARLAFGLGFHAEVYSDLDELLERAGVDGIVLAPDAKEPGAVATLIGRLNDSGLPLPVVIVSSEPHVERAVSAIKAGALDYLALPLESHVFAGRIALILGEAEQYVRERRREVDAKQAISCLSRREREVLELLSAGCSNKDIGLRLHISPRTAEIHRGKMMLKLRAGKTADAVRVWFEAGMSAQTGQSAVGGSARPASVDVSRPATESRVDVSETHKPARRHQPNRGGASAE